ncbi:trypsin-like peptidase domain-containing protein [Tolypothrix sp. PCC 7910]|uniref:trypsin-like peptidase domain-containing protein n=1 Tax=Tolypothrix sp. PCC 7910 TaxID=2099387 RepID=UPI00142793CE|nr:trypsin-like peptidase domain-containing protein [Tolypothrix sp. PCC 7910]QIR36918.1 trypsin-like peptidase domain-containing protein [Tolypothrix sp. PCC 7910]
MVNLEVEDRKQLITLLKDIPELATERSRQQILELADLKQLIPMIDISGASFVAVSEIVSYLSKYGRLTYDHEALGLFLNTLKSFVGVQQQLFLDMLLTKYDMMTPIAALPAINNWRARETTADIFEKIIGENTLRPISFLQHGLEVARSVAYIGVRTSQERWSGTGFLVAPNLLLTNNHVLPSSDLLSGTILRFNYEENFQGEAQITDEYRPKSKGIFHTNQSLDYTVVEIAGEPGKKWGWLQLSRLPTEIRRDSRVNIIQHPQGQPKQISLQNNFVQYVGGNVVQYVTSTLQGSSGSPVLNDFWEVIALHHAGGNILEPTTQQRYFRNEGILIESILSDLPSEILDLLINTKNT